MDPLRDFDDLNEQHLTNIYYHFWAYLRLAGRSLSSFEFSGILYVTY